MSASAAKRWLSGRLPLKWILVVPFLLQLGLTVGVVAYLAHQNDRRVVEALAYQMMEEVSDRIHDNLDDFVETPYQLTQQNLLAIAQGNLDWQDPEIMERYFWTQLQTWDQANSISITTEDELFMMLSRQDDQSFVVQLYDSQEPVQKNYRIQSPGDRSQLIWENPTFHPHQDPPRDPWYSATRSAGEPIQGFVVSLADPDRPTVAWTYFAPVYDANQTFQGVVSSSIYLSKATDFLSSLSIGQNGQAFIIDRQGQLIATSTGEQPFRTEIAEIHADNIDPQQRRLPSRDSADPVTQAIGETIATDPTLLNLQQHYVTDLTLGEQSYFLDIQPFQSELGVDWLIVTIVPQSDFLAPIQADTHKKTMLIVVVALMGAIAIGVVTASWITRTIRRIDHAAKQLVNGELALIPCHPIGELNDLAIALNDMATQLHESFKHLNLKNEALSESGQRLQQFLDAMPVGVSVHTPDGIIFYINQPGQQLLGKENIPEATVPELSTIFQIYRQGTHQLYPSEQLPVVLALQGNIVKVEDIEIHHPDRIIPLEVYATPIKDSAGQILYAITTFQDITQRKHAEQVLANSQQILEQQVAERTAALQNSEAMQSAILNAIPDLLERVTRDGCRLAYIPGDEVQRLGDPEMMVGKLLQETWPPDLLEERLHYIQQALETKQRQLYEYEITIQGDRRYEEARIVPYNDNEVLIIVRDITQHKLAEAALQRSQTQLEKLAISAPGNIYTLVRYPDNSLEFEYVNPVIAEILEFPLHEIQQNPDVTIRCLHPDDREDYLAKMQQSAETLETFRHEWRIITPNGTVKWLQGNSQPEQREDGSIAWYGIVLDISDRKQIEATQSAIIRAIPDLMTLVSEEGIILSRVRLNEEIDCIPHHLDPYGRHLLEVTPLDVAQRQLRAIHAAIETKEVQIYEQWLTIHHQNSESRIQYEEVRVAPCGDRQALVMVRDISDRKRVEVELSKQKEFLQTIIDIVPSSIFVKDPDGKFIVVNQAAAVVYGVPPQNLLGKTDADFNDDAAQVAEFLATNREVMDTRQSKSFPEQMIINTQGEPFWFKTIISPFCPYGDEVQGIIGSSTNITDLKQTELALQKAKDEAEAANRAKSLFLANMSHELRTPLNVILGFAQVMSRDEGVTAEQHEHLSIILRSGDHLLNLINSILDLSKIEAGQISITTTDFDLHELLHGLRTMLTLRAESKGLQFRVNSAPDVPHFISTDANKLRQILINLLGNAIKFTDQGVVALHVAIAPQPPSSSQISSPNPLAPFCDRPQTWLICQVEDSGHGIPDEDLNQIFEAFNQSDQGKLSAEGGTGLGLTISSKFAQLLGGNLTVTSQIGVGTTFQLALPIGVSSPTQVPSLPMETRRVLSLAGDTNYRILVVDDQLENRQLLHQLLAKVGFVVTEATNGEEAIATWKTWHPDLILMDIRMPIMDGYTATKHIREREEQSTHADPVKIIALTASAFSDDRYRALKVGCNEFVSKPFQEQDLFGKISEHLPLQYKYADDDNETSQGLPPTSEISTTLTAQQLCVMPLDWLKNLHGAAQRCYDEELYHLIDQIPTDCQSVDLALRALVRDFRFDQILILSEQAVALRTGEAHDTTR